MWGIIAVIVLVLLLIFSGLAGLLMRGIVQVVSLIFQCGGTVLGCILKIIILFIVLYVIIAVLL